MKSYLVDRKIGEEHLQYLFKIEFPGICISQNLIEKYETRIYSAIRKGLFGATLTLADNLNINHATDSDENAWFTYHIELSDEYDADDELDFFMDWFDYFCYLQ